MVLATFISLSLPAKLEKRVIIILGNVLMSVGLIFVGPSHLLHIPNSPSLVAMGLSLGGFGQGLAAGFMLEEAFKGALEQYPQ